MYSIKKISTCVLVCILLIGSTIFAQDDRELAKMSLEDLMNLKVVTASKTIQKTSEAPAIVTVITADDIQKLGATSLEDLLRIVPGFDSMKRAEVPTINYSVRGLPLAKIKFLINGYELANLSDAPNYYMAFFPIEIIKRIEIIRGPGSALYGTNAFNAVIQIFTQDGNDESEVGLEVGSYNSIRPSIAYTVNKDNFSTYIYADIFKTDGSSELIEKDFASRIFSPELSSTPGYTTNNADGGFLTIHSSLNKLTLDIFATSLNLKEPVGRTFSLVDDGNIKAEAYNVGLSYETPFRNKNGIFSIKGYQYYHSHDFLYEMFNEEISEVVFHNSPGYQLLANPTISLQQTGIEVGMQYQLSPTLNIVAGSSFEYQNQYDIKHSATYNTTPIDITFDGTIYPPGASFGSKRDITELANWNEEKQRDVFATFAQCTLDIKKAIGLENLYSAAITIGARYDYYSDVGKSINPRFGLVVAPTEKLYFKGLYGSAFYAPVMLSLYSKNNPVQIANPNLGPENIDTYELSAGYYLTNSIMVSVTGFYSKINDYVYRYLPHGESITTWKNIGKLTAQGVEAEFTMRFPEGHSGFFNMTYQTLDDISHLAVGNEASSFVQEDYKPGNAPSLIMNLGGNYVATSNIDIDINLNYINGRKRSEEKGYDANGNIVQIDQRADLKPRLLVNGAVTVGNFPFMQNVKLKLIGKNLLETDYRDPVIDGQVPNDLPRYGRVFMAKLTYRF